jgi:hypothetical protein
MLVNTGFYWSTGQIFNEIFNGFSSRSLSGAGTSRTRPLHGCGSKSDLISLQNESSGLQHCLDPRETRGVDLSVEREAKRQALPGILVAQPERDRNLHEHHHHRIHNFALDINWLPWPVLPKKRWPAIKFEEKRAIIRYMRDPA